MRTYSEGQVLLAQREADSSQNRLCIRCSNAVWFSNGHYKTHKDTTDHGKMVTEQKQSTGVNMDNTIG